MEIMEELKDVFPDWEIRNPPVFIRTIPDITHKQKAMLLDLDCEECELNISCEDAKKLIKKKLKEPSKKQRIFLLNGGFIVGNISKDEATILINKIIRGDL